MRDAPILTDELAQRVESLLRAWRRAGRSPHGGGQEFGRMARELGVGLVDLARSRAWVDERVHEGALIRAREAEARASSVLAAVAGGAWPADELSGEYDQ